MAMELSELKYIKLTADTEILPFHSTDKDFNDFLTEDAKEGLQEMSTSRCLTRWNQLAKCSLILRP